MQTLIGQNAVSISSGHTVCISSGTRILALIYRQLFLREVFAHRLSFVFNISNIDIDIIAMYIIIINIIIISNVVACFRKGILDDFDKFTDGCREEFASSSKNVHDAISEINKETEYDNFTLENK